MPDPPGQRQSAREAARHRERAAERATPGWIVLPAFRAGESPALTALPKSSGFMRLVDSAFNYSMLGRRGFDMLADVVERSGCHEFTYGGQLDEAVRLFDALADER